MDDPAVDVIVTEVLASRKYAQIDPALVRRLTQSAVDIGLKGKAAVKEVRSRLHQIGGAYFKHKPNYDTALSQLSALPPHLHSDRIKNWCIEKMRAHASTAERLPILADFFHSCLDEIRPVKSVVDLACGLNPLAIPWMPLSEDFTYIACDIFQDMLSFLDGYFQYLDIRGTTISCDLTQQVPQQQAQLAFLLKTVPCLEQIDKNCALPILEAIQCDHILVSFPAHSLSGKSKGMPAYYRDHFLHLIAGKNWQVREFSFSTEIAFLVTK